MKRVLIISYYWPPTGGSGVQRWVKFAKYLPSEGWMPVIYTPENPEMLTVDASLADEIPAEVEVIKRPIFEPYNLYRALTGGKKKDKKDSREVNPINSRKKSLGQKVSMWIRGNCFIPDPRCFWIGPSVRFLKKYLKEHPVDIIVSTGPPHSMHLIARKVARATGVPWVADFRDPWTKMFYFKHLSLSVWAEKKHEKLEKKVLDEASVVVAVSPLVQEEFQQMTSNKVELITNGYDDSDFPTENKETGEFFDIAHTGLFAADGNPTVLWKALGDKCREEESFRKALRIKLIGKTDREIISAVKEAGLEENLIDLGYQDHKVAVCEQRNAAVLILPLRKEPEYRATLPGKLFEYLASQRPVLGIGQKDGAMARILAETNAGEVYDWEEYESIKAYIDRSWEKFQSGTLVAETENIEKYSRRELTRTMAALFEKLLKNE